MSWKLGKTYKLNEKPGKHVKHNAQKRTKLDREESSREHQMLHINISVLIIPSLLVATAKARIQIDIVLMDDAITV